ALYLAFRGEDPKQVIEVLGSLSPWIFAAALGIYLLSQLIFVARWSLLLKVHSIRIGFWPAVRLHFLGLFYNNCLPSAVGGDLLRAWYVTRHTDKKVEAALSVFVDRVVGLTAMLIMAAFAYLLVPAQRPTEQFETRFAGADVLRHLADYKWFIAGAGLVIVIAAAVLASTAGGRALLKRWLRLIRMSCAVVIAEVVTSIRIYWARKSVFIYALLLAFCCQSLFILGMWLMGRGIGVTAPIKYYFIFFPISWLLGTLPISVGGAGIMELWLKTMFIGVCAVSSEHALALALCQRLLWLFGSLPGAVIHLIGAHLPKDFFVDYEKPIN
ncbi:MAG: lysylphosphatidylglycerol synthase transmembrane domain-containing protein, partial [Planctomycetota bacterium]